MTIKSIFAALAFSAASLMAAPASAVIITGNTNTPICDLCTINSTLDASSHLVIQDLNVLSDRLTHSWVDDLIITTPGPKSTSVLLSNRRGGSQNNHQSTVFDDAATTAIAFGSAPENGTFKPEETLSAFDGADAFGTGALRVRDVVALDNGTRRNRELDITPTPVPEPATTALLGLGLLGVAASRRKSAKK